MCLREAGSCGSLSTSFTVCTRACLDILTNIIDAPEVLIKDCADDGLGACVEKGYYFRPGETEGAIIGEVKANWQRAYSEGKVKFKSPAWLR